MLVGKPSAGCGTITLPILSPANSSVSSLLEDQGEGRGNQLLVLWVVLLAQRINHLLCHGKGLVQAAFSDEYSLEFAHGPQRQLAHGTKHLHIVLVGTEGLLLSGDQIQLPSARRPVCVVAHVSTLGGVVLLLAVEAFAMQVVIVGVAWEGGEETPRRNGVDEELVSSTMVT